MVGVEFTSCPALPSVPVPGTKLVLDAPLVRHGALLLDSGTVAVLGGEVPGLVAAARRASESWVKHVGWRNYKGGESKSLDELAALAREAAWEGRGPEGPDGRAEVLDLCDDEGDDEETPPGGAAGGAGGGPDARTAKRARRAGLQQAAAPPPAALAPSGGGGAELRRAVEAASRNPQYCGTVTVRGAHIRGITGMNDAGASPAPSTNWRVSVTIEDGTSCVEADLAPEVTAQHFIRVARCLRKLAACAAGGDVEGREHPNSQVARRRPDRLPSPAAAAHHRPVRVRVTRLCSGQGRCGPPRSGGRRRPQAAPAGGSQSGRRTGELVPSFVHARLLIASSHAPSNP